MRLEDLARLGLPECAPRVPAWSFGFWRRKSITFANGLTDSGTRVFWLQSGGLTADLRLPARRFDATSLDARARLEGWLAQTSWDGQKMSWSNGTSFQLHDKWPEPALLTRIGDCLIEFAPSGIYVEDWRLQPSAPGLFAGLKLIEERDGASGAVRHRGGGLIVTGDHAALVKGRPAALPATGRLENYVAGHAHDEVALDAVFAFETSYGRRTGDGGYVVEASTCAAREGAALISLGGFSWDAPSGTVVQRTEEDGRDIERIFTVDTLKADFAFDCATPAAPEANAWLATERVTLLRDAAPLAPQEP